MEAPNKNLLGQQFEAEESSAPLLNGSNTDIENAGEKKSSTIMYSNPKRKSNLKDIEYAFSYDRTRDPVEDQNYRMKIKRQHMKVRNKEMIQQAEDAILMRHFPNLVEGQVLMLQGSSNTGKKSKSLKITEEKQRSTLLGNLANRNQSDASTNSILRRSATQIEPVDKKPERKLSPIVEEEDLREAQKEVTKDYEDMTDSEVHRQSTVGISKYC